MKQRFSIILYILSLLSVMPLTGCNGTTGSGSDRYRRISGEIWHTFYNIAYCGSESLRDSVIPVLEEVGASLSVFEPNSLVSAVNRQTATPVDHHFRQVYKMVCRINRASHGMFDPTISPLITAWGFGRGHRATSDTLRIDSLLAITGLDRTHLMRDTLFKDDPRIEFNFSAIAKGYGVDCVAEMLRRNGVTDFMVEIGGEIRASGRNPKGELWHIAIAEPVADESDSGSSSGDPDKVIAFTDMGMATSGNYRNFHGAGTSRYGHTISPVTGRPAATDVASVTVMAPTCMEADALATASMALGSTEAKALLDSLALPYLIIRTDMTTILSRSMDAMLVR